MKKYKVVVLTLAREDVKEARIWYNKKQKGLGKRFIADMKISLLKMKATLNLSPFVMALHDVQILTSFPMQHSFS